MRRRGFLAAPVAALGAQGGASNTIHAIGDGVPHSPAEYAQLLSRLAPAAAADDYSTGGVVEQLERRMAAALGKETAVWMPTGTLANHLAVRMLAGEKRRVAVQAESHLYNDSGDCAATLSGLTLLPLAPGKAGFTLGELEAALERTASGRVAAPAGAVQIETPVRRMRGARFDFAEAAKISSWARERRIGLHLDGARIFIESVYTGIPLKQYAALFDTVYVSLYKYFNAASGAILAGPRPLLENARHSRRMFGGGLAQVWPFAAVALHSLDGFEARFGAAVKASEQVLATLAADANFELQRVPEGTNVFRLRTTNVNAPIYHGRLREAAIETRDPDPGGWFTLQVNETWMRVPPAEITSRFRRALG